MAEQEYDERRAPQDHSETVLRLTHYGAFHLDARPRLRGRRRQPRGHLRSARQGRPDCLIDWYRSASHPENRSGRITERGVNVIEEVTCAGSSQIDYIRKLIAVVDHSNVSEQEKKQATILLESLANNELIIAALGMLLR